jgi:hypothetical protein
MVDIDKANQEAITRLLSAQPILVGMGLAKDVIPDMGERVLLHAGPPIDWENMSGPMRGAVMAACLYEGWAETPEEAQKIAEKGDVSFDPCHHHHAVGPMAGVTSPNMPVFIVENGDRGNKAFCSMNEGLGKVMRMGAFSPEVIEHLKWMRHTLYPNLQAGVKKAFDEQGGIDLKNIMAQSLHMGDEMHNRNKAGTSLFFRAIAPFLVETAPNAGNLPDIFRFIDKNDHFFLNLAMAAAKASTEASHGVEGSSLVTTMARNGTEMGVRISGLGDQWFTCEAALPDVLLFPGFTKADVNRDIGDSAIMETLGIGGFALAAAPAIVQFIGGTPEDAAKYTFEMYEITMVENNTYTIPSLNFRGTPTGIDVIKVVETGISPVLDTGAAHKEPGKGQVGAGIVRMPAEAFNKAAAAFVDKYLED